MSTPQIFIISMALILMIFIFILIMFKHMNKLPKLPKGRAYFQCDKNFSHRIRGNKLVIYTNGHFYCPICISEKYEKVGIGHLGSRYDRREVAR